MKLRELVNSVGILKTLANKKLKGSLSYKIFRACELVDEHLKTYEEVRLRLLNQYGKLNKEGTNYTFTNKNKAEAFTKEFEALLETDIEITLPSISVEDIDTIEDITASEIRTLKWMIK